MTGLDYAEECDEAVPEILCILLGTLVPFTARDFAEQNTVVVGVPYNYGLSHGSNGSTLRADINAAGDNMPRYSAHFSGSVSGGHLND